MAAIDAITRRDFLSRTLTVGTVVAAASQLQGSLASAALARQEESPWQIGIYTRPWAHCEYLEALDAIAEAGFKHVGFMTTKSPDNLILSVNTKIEEAHKVGEECKKRGLKVPSVWGGGIPVQDSLEAGITGLRKLIDNCAASGGRNLLMGGAGKPDLFADYYKAITECCDYAAEKGIGLSIKPHGGSNATGLQCRKTIDLVGKKNFRIWYDPGNILYYSDGVLDPVDDAPSVDGLVVGMSVKDFIMPEVDGKPRKDVAITPGTGRVDFPKVMARLKTGGFKRGPLVIECLGKFKGKALIAEAIKARKFVENLVD